MLNTTKTAAVLLAGTTLAEVTHTSQSQGLRVSANKSSLVTFGLLVIVDSSWVVHAVQTRGLGPERRQPAG